MLKMQPIFRTSLEGKRNVGHILHGSNTDGGRIRVSQQAFLNTPRRHVRGQRG